MVGNRSARRTLISARAARRFASASRIVWLACSTCGSRALNWTSSKTVHHAPLGIASIGFAGTQSAPPEFTSLKASGPASLNAAGAGPDGTTYFGPTRQPPRQNSAQPNAPSESMLFLIPLRLPPPEPQRHRQTRVPTVLRPASQPDPESPDRLPANPLKLSACFHCPCRL